MTGAGVDDLGSAVPLDGPPRRLVSLVPSLSEVLWWWRFADRVVGVTDWCVAPPRAFDHAARVRGTKNPDVAAVIALQPDLVVASEEENREVDVRRLREAGVVVHVTRVRSVEDAATSLVRLGTVLGVAGAAEGLSAAIRHALGRVPHVGAQLRTFCPVWRDPWMAVGRATYSGDLLARCGFSVLPDEAEARYPEVGLDQVAAADPDVVLLPDEPYRFGERDRQVFVGWRARVRRIDGTALTWWGPRTPAALADLAALASGLSRSRRRARGHS